MRKNYPFYIEASYTQRSLSQFNGLARDLRVLTMPITDIRWYAFILALQLNYVCRYFLLTPVNGGIQNEVSAGWCCCLQWDAALVIYLVFFKSAYKTKLYLYYESLGHEADDINPTSWKLQCSFGCVISLTSHYCYKICTHSVLSLTAYFGCTSYILCNF